MPQFLRIGSYYIDQLLIVVKVNFFLHSKYYLYTNSVHKLSTLYIKRHKKSRLKIDSSHLEPPSVRDFYTLPANYTPRVT